MALTRSQGKQINLQASLLHGKVQLVELALRSAAGTGGFLNISHRVPFDDLAKRMPGAVLAFVPASFAEQAMYQEYVRYFGSKARAGVANLDNAESLYMVPPVGEASALLAALEASGAPAPLPRNCLLGVITARPSAQGLAAAAAASALAATGAPPVPAVPAAAEPNAADSTATAAPAAATAAPTDTSVAPAEKKEEVPLVETKLEAGAAKASEENENEEGGEMSGEALMNLFSNPDLIKSLQGADEGKDNGDD
jgi:hypothetical protein